MGLIILSSEQFWENKKARHITYNMSSLMIEVPIS